MVGREGEGVWSRDVLDVALHGDWLLPARLHPPKACTTSYQTWELANPPFVFGLWGNFRAI